MKNFNIKDIEDLPASIESLIKVNKQKHMLVLLPGGSFAKIIPQLVSSLNDSKLDLSHVTFSVIDERYELHPDEANNNFLKLRDCGLEELEGLGATLMPIVEDGETLETATENFRTVVTEYLEDEDKVVAALAGVDTDYHLAGLLPYKQEYATKFEDQVVVSYDVEDHSISNDKHRYRISLAFQGIKSCDYFGLFAVGGKKYRVLKNILAVSSPTRKEIAHQPAYVLATLNREVDIFTDQNLFD